GSGINGQIPVCACRSSRAVRVDDDQAGALPPRFLDKRPQVDVVAMDVRAPGNDGARVPELLGPGAQLGSDHRSQPSFPSFRADVARQPRRSQAMEETTVHRGAVQNCQRTAVRARKDGLGAVLGDDGAKAFGDLIQCVVPGDALEVAEISTAFALGYEPPQRGEDAL